MHDDLTEIAGQLEGKTPQEILRWAVDAYHPRLTLATAFGAEGCVLIHLLAEIRADVDVFNLETGYQFPETLDTRRRLVERYGIPIRFVSAEQSVEELERAHDGPLYDRDPNRCCYLRKIVPLQQALVGVDAWISAIRREQTPDRAHAGAVEWDHKFGLVKVNPLVAWTKKDVWSFILKHDVPYNPLHDQGYPSIGCWPCTRPVGANEGDRAGRWAGTAKTECGLHAQTPLVQVGINR